MALNYTTNLSTNGLREWVIQRVSAIVLVAYVLFLLVFMGMHPSMEYVDWHDLFLNPWMRIASVLMLLSLISHAWIGIIRVTNDYITCAYLRIGLQILFILGFIGFLVWGIAILWG